MTDASSPQVHFRLGVIGDPVAHSISPAIQQAAFDAVGLRATYERWHTPLDDLKDRIASLRAEDVMGANVTVPHKQAVMPLLDEVASVARQAGAVNMIIHREGRLSGDNTDVYGLQTAVQGICPNVETRDALILGAGGAARAVVLGLLALGVSRIAIWNRNPGRARVLATDLGFGELEICEEHLEALTAAVARTSFLINATSLGWHGEESPIPLMLLDRLDPHAIVMDLTYRDTALLRSARDRGLQTLDGLPMLVHQGARAFELWTGQEAPLPVMFEAARRAREA
jgi:shikimate dehydrogenase